MAERLGTTRRSKCDRVSQGRTSIYCLLGRIFMPGMFVHCTFSVQNVQEDTAKIGFSKIMEKI